MANNTTKADYAAIPMTITGGLGFYCGVYNSSFGMSDWRDYPLSTSLFAGMNGVFYAFGAQIVSEDYLEKHGKYQR